MIQFDEELAKRGIDVYMYDYTIDSLPFQNIKFHWKKIGIAGKSSKEKNLKTLEELLIENNHIYLENMILKLDVSNWEWESLVNLPEYILKKFKYILIEFHFFNPNTDGKLYYQVLKKIHKFHQSFYFRCNGRDEIVSFGNNRICKFIEVSYIRRDNYNFVKDDSILPLFEFDWEDYKQNGKEEMEVIILFFL